MVVDIVVDVVVYRQQTTMIKQRFHVYSCGIKRRKKEWNGFGMVFILNGEFAKPFV